MPRWNLVSDEPENSKRCSECKIIKSLDDFHKSKHGRKGRASKCKECIKPYCQSANKKWRNGLGEDEKASLVKRHREWANKNRDKVKSYVNKYDNSHADKRKEYREKNKDKINSKTSKWYSDNLEREREKRRKYHKDHPERWRADSAKRKAIELGLDASYSAGEWLELLKFYNGKCLKCGSGEDIEADHIVPLSKGGRGTIDNIQPLCATCNQRKGRKTVDYRSPS